MKLISNKVLREFSVIHPAAVSPLQDWRHLVERGDYRNFAELRSTFASVDKVGERFVFNLGGNKYRLVAAITFSVRAIWIKSVLTHADYDKGVWK